MPLYEYECEKCGRRFEVIQKFSDAPIEACQSCGGAVRKLLASPAIQFKGTGWYITDYAQKPGAPSGDGHKDTKTDSATPADSSSSTSSEKTSASSGSTSEKSSS